MNYINIIVSICIFMSILILIVLHISVCVCFYRFELEMKHSLNKLVIIAIPCLLRGGTEMQTLLLSRALIESGYDVEVICYFESDESVVFEFKRISAEVILLQWPRSRKVHGQDPFCRAKHGASRI